ncbi:MAG: nuclear transport factor 2 family protein [Steroidobacteraceae bacterium]
MLRSTLLVTVFACVMAAAARPAPAGPSPATLEDLLGRAQIANMLAAYYGNLGGADRDMGSFYTADGVLDVNGIIARGPKAVDALYQRIARGSPRLPGKYNMLLTNPRIVVHGDTATADVIWTGIDSPTPESTPRFIEQGREHDELVERDGRWYFTHRVITSDAGLPAMFRKTYRNR